MFRNQSFDSTVVVLGGGIGGLETALRAERKGFDVKLVDPSEEMVFYPSSYSIIEGRPEEEITINYESKFSGRNIEHIKGRFEGLKKNDQKVLLNNREMNYDYLVFSLGAEDNYHGIDADAKTFRSLKDLRQINEEVEKGNIDNAVIVGGGTTGVGAAASLAELRERLNQEFEITLLQDIGELVPRLNDETCEKALKVLESKGVEVKFNEAVTSAEEGKVKTENSVYESDLTIWAAGIKKKSTLEDLELEQDFKGLKVDDFNRIKDEKEIFAVGDNCSYEGKRTRATYALFEAKTAAKNILRTEKGLDLKKRKISYDATLLYLGPSYSVFEFGDRSFSGLIPSLMERLGVEKRYMIFRKHFL